MEKILFLLFIMLLYGCSGPFGGTWGVIPQNTEVCPQGRDAVSGVCR